MKVCTGCSSISLLPWKLGFFFFLSISCSLSGLVRSNSSACHSQNVCLHKEENAAPPFCLSSSWWVSLWLITSSPSRDVCVGCVRHALYESSGETVRYSFILHKVSFKDGWFIIKICVSPRTVCVFCDSIRLHLVAIWVGWT